MNAEPAPTATETVTRPDPGLARGRWEAPVWVFWALLAVVVLGATGYLLQRLGYLKRARAKADKNEAQSGGSTNIRRP